MFPKRDVSMKTGVTLEMFFDLFFNVEDYMDFIRLRLSAFEVDENDTFEVAAFLSDDKNRNKLLDMSGIDNFVFGFFKDPEFVNKLNVFTAGNDVTADFGEGWSLANWFSANLENWGQEGWTYPSITAMNELLEFFDTYVMNNSGLVNLGWGAPFVMNLINCAR